MLTISNLSFAIEGNPLFDNTSANIPTGHKVGIVGRNGTGKTTLFKLIKNEYHPDSGSIDMPSYFRIGGVEQEAPANEVSLLDTVLAADEERAALLAEAEIAAEPERMAEVYQRLNDIDAYSAEARASSILSGLGFDQYAQARPCQEFSGGWRMRVALAAVLFSQPDLLLLDEPTNYLDLEGAVWLEQFLAKYQKTALIISHDRELLNRSVTGILHLSHLSLNYYSGNYDQFDNERRAKLEQQQSMRRKQDMQRAHIERFVERFRAKASKARQAQSRLKQLEKMKPIMALTENVVAGFRFPTPSELKPPLLVVEKGQVGYDNKAVLSRLELRLDSDDRIALLGANGEGKSTLSKLFADRLPLMDGHMFKTNKLRVGFFAQHQLDELIEGDSAYTHIMRLRPNDDEKILRARLGASGFGVDIADLPVEKLSGGQKARLLMLMATIDAPHILILDEPTNHLDIESREALVMALNEYEGAVILVSHDSHLVETVADKLWLVNDGAVADFDGDMEDYKALVMEAHKKSKSRKARASDSLPKSDQPKVNIARLKKQSGELEKKMEKLTAKKHMLEAEMAAPEFYQAHSQEAVSAKTDALSDTIGALSALEDEWLDLQSQIETA